VSCVTSLSRLPAIGSSEPLAGAPVVLLSLMLVMGVLSVYDDGLLLAVTGNGSIGSV